MDKTYVTSDYDLNANHCVPTLNYGMQCEVFGEPYLGKCDYDGAGAGLKVRTLHTPNYFIWSPH